MTRMITIAPVTRIEGHLTAKAEIGRDGKVREAFLAGTSFRDFENIAPAVGGPGAAAGAAPRRDPRVRPACLLLQPERRAPGRGRHRAEPRQGGRLQYAGGTISRCQIVTPTCWNASPADDRGHAGPMEQALVGTSVARSDEPIELLRIVHSFDPCLSCSVHALEL